MYPGAYLYQPSAVYVPPTYTAGSAIFGGVGGVPTEDNANFFYDDTNNFLGLGVNASLQGRLHVKGHSDTVGNAMYVQNLSNTFSVKVANIAAAATGAYVIIDVGFSQQSSSILSLTSGGQGRFNFREEGYLAFASGAFIGVLKGGSDNTLRIVNNPSSLGVSVHSDSSIAYGTHNQFSVGLGNSYLGATSGTKEVLVSIAGTFNQSSGTGEAMAIRVISTLTSVTGSFVGFDFDPTVTSAAALYGLRFRPAATQSAFSMSAVPTAKIHIGAGTAAAGTGPLKFTSGTLVSTTEAGLIEFDGTHLYFTVTDSGARYQLDQQISGPVEVNMDGLPDTDHSAVGHVTSTFNAGTTVAIMETVRMHSDGEWALTDATDEATSFGTLAIALAAGTDGNPMKVALPGTFVRDDSWNWTPGQQLYLSLTPGQITATAPSATDEVVRVIGHAVHADVIFFEPSPDYLVIV